MRRGFSLISLMMAMVIMTLVVVATVQLMAAMTMTNRQTTPLTQAIFLANNVHEYAMTLAVKDPNGAYTHAFLAPPNCLDVHDLDTTGQTPQYVSCIDVQGNPLTSADYTKWTQKRTVTSFDLAAPNTVATDSDTNARLLTVEIRCNGTTVYTTTWVFAPTLP